MIAGGVFGGISNLFRASNTRFSFQIYDMSALTPAGTADLNAAAYVSFDGYMGLRYANNVIIPQQTLENREFSNDSIIDNPFRLSISAVISQHITSLTDLYSDYAPQALSTLEFLGKSNTLVVIFRTNPMFKTYTNMKLESWDYDQTPSNTAFIARLNFREIRATYVPNDNLPTQNANTNLNNTFNTTASSNPANAKNIDNGLINTTSPTGSTTNLSASTGVVLA